MAPVPSPISPPRIPYPEAAMSALAVDRAAWRTLIDTIFPAAKTTEGIFAAVAYCRARGLDVFKRPVSIVPVWNGAMKREVETVWAGISEIRTTAHRTGQYAGADKPEFGPMVTETFKGASRGQSSETREMTVTYPEWCTFTAYRIVNGNRCPFPATVFWLEAYGRWKGTDVPNEMWAKRTMGQLMKCAEAAALRMAFPEEIGNDYTADEMVGQTVTFAAAEAPPIKYAPNAKQIAAPPPAVLAPATMDEAIELARKHFDELPDAPPPPDDDDFKGLPAGAGEEE